MADRGATDVVMEVSSHALAQPPPGQVLESLWQRPQVLRWPL